MTGLLGAADLPAPIGDRWFQDYVPGSVVEFGDTTLSEAEIVAFARDYDPQPIHADPAWSATGSARAQSSGRPAAVCVVGHPAQRCERSLGPDAVPLHQHAVGLPYHGAIDDPLVAVGDPLPSATAPARCVANGSVRGRNPRC